MRIGLALALLGLVSYNAYACEDDKQHDNNDDRDDPPLGRTETCGPGCEICISLLQCIQCQEDYYFVQVQESAGRCRLQCPVGFVANDNVM